MAEYIEREAYLEELKERHDYVMQDPEISKTMKWCEAVCYNRAKDILETLPAADVVEVRHGYHAGDVCIYGFGHENKSRTIVEIVRILNDERGVAEVKFLKVFVDDTGNGYFNYLLKSGNTMNASFQYLKNITPRMDGE